MRAGDRRRGSGKSARILDLIDHYWDQIEGDFATILHGTDAGAWIRGERPWPQFLNYCNTIAQEQGGRLWAAQLSDSRFDDELEEQIAKSTDDARPPLEGDTAIVRAIRVLSNDIRLLIRLTTRVSLRSIDGPIGPDERLANRKRSFGRARIDELLARANTPT